MTRKYHIWTIGCQMNEADSRHLESQLEALGYRPEERAESADLVILNTCVVRQQAEDKATSRLNSLKSAKQENPAMTIGLMGCMVGMKEEPALRLKFPFVDVFMPPSETTPLLEFLAARGLHEHPKLMDAREKAVRDAIQDEEYILPVLRRKASVTANVPVVLGCSHACTFCVIPYRRGAERSRPREEVLREVSELVDQGVREVTLLGQIIDRYGMDFAEPYDLADLMKEISGIAGLHRIRFLTGHPNYMTDKLIRTVAESEKICPQFEVPVQAGNNEVLERMRRGYTREDYYRVVERIRNILPDAAIHTDIIVGFPGETRAQFEDTVRVLEDLRVDKAHLNKYSERPKTIAARQMPDDVPQEEKEERWRILEDLQTAILAEKMSALQDTVVEVLAEGRAKGQWRGRTPHCKTVYFDAPTDPTGQLVDVRVTKTTPYSVTGLVIAK